MKYNSLDDFCINRYILILLKEKLFTMKQSGLMQTGIFLCIYMLVNRNYDEDSLQVDKGCINVHITFRLIQNRLLNVHL